MQPDVFDEKENTEYFKKKLSDEILIDFFLTVGIPDQMAIEII